MICFPSRALRASALAVCFGLLCAASAARAQQPPRSAGAPAPLWTTEGTSSGGLPLEVFRSGSGALPVVIVGSLIGNEPQTAQLLDSVAELIRKFPPPASLKLILVRSANPDGLREHIATNAHGADLGRGFPNLLSSRTAPVTTGPRPQLEREVEFLTRLLGEARPARVIHVRGNYTQQSLIEVGARWPALDKDKILPADIAWNRTTGEVKAGSLEEYSQRVLGADWATVFIPPPGGRQMQASELLRLASAHVAAPAAVNLAQQNEEPARLRDPLGEMPAIPQRVKEVEFLPPPPEYAGTSNAGPDGRGLRPRYEDLPKPPRS